MSSSFSSITTTTTTDGQTKKTLTFGKEVKFARKRADDGVGYRYWCPDCGQELVGGPRAPNSVNVVCRSCRVNWGCLPDFYD